MSYSSRMAYQLRGLFVVYFAARVMVDVVMGWDVTREALRGGYIRGGGRVIVSPELLLTLIGITMAVVFAVGLWLFGRLLRKENWARVVLLIVGWIAVFGAVSSLLLTSSNVGLTSVLGRIVPGLDWQRLLLIDRIKDTLALLFWGYTIYVLLGDPRFRQDFGSPPDSHGTAGP